ncbi:MAG: hypothetical protein IRY85_09985 [Micromonosporaceae bacterium]|nr:hypothetical protein [Micromonosporaceae bacterium]
MTSRWMSRVRDRAWLERERDEALRQRMIAERTFAVIQSIYYRHYPDRVTAEYHAAANPYLKGAQSDAQWYGQRAEMLSAVLASLGGER